MGFRHWNTWILCGFLLALAGCGAKDSAPPSIFEKPTEDSGIVTIFSEDDAPAPRAPIPPKPSATDAPALEIFTAHKKRYPPPDAPPAPMAPRGPPMAVHRNYEPPPSKYKSIPDFKVEKLGIWDCDHYAEQFLVCINERVPRDQDGDLAKAFALKVKQWKEKAGSEAGRSAVVQECQSALARSKKAMQPYGCVWR